MPYVLLVLLYNIQIGSASLNPIGGFSAEFSSQAACMVAYDALIKRGAGNAEMTCVPK